MEKLLIDFEHPVVSKIGVDFGEVKGHKNKSISDKGNLKCT